MTSVSTVSPSFYPYYLQEHSNAVCRRLHYVGSLLVLAVLFHAVASQQWLWLLALPLVGYGFAWVGHFRPSRRTARPPSSTRCGRSWATG
ncbi:membrane protein [Pseudomonas aeruginosa]|nr:membrane protein [Pseudomonas aeruginosa]